MENVGFKINHISVTSDGMASVKVRFDGAKKSNVFSRKYKNAVGKNGEKLFKVALNGCKVLFDPESKAVVEVIKVRDTKGRLSVKSLREASKPRKRKASAKRTVAPVLEKSTDKTETKALSSAEVIGSPISIEELDWVKKGNSYSVVTTRNSSNRYIRFCTDPLSKSIDAILEDSDNGKPWKFASYKGKNPMTWISNVISSFSAMTSEEISIHITSKKTSKDIICIASDDRITDAMIYNKCRVYYGNTKEEVLARANNEDSEHLASLWWLDTRSKVTPFHLWDDKASDKRFSSLATKYVVLAD